MSDRLDSNFAVNVFWFVWNACFTVFDIYYLRTHQSNWLVWTGLALCGSVALMNFIVIVYKTYLIRKRIANEAKN